MKVAKKGATTKATESKAEEGATEKAAPVETKEVAVKETAPAPAVQDDLAGWGQADISSRDIIIPRILLMQPMSEKVTAGEAAFGEFRESLNNEKIGNFEKGFNILPFHMEKVFVEFNCEDPEEKEFLRVVPITAANENLPYEDEEFNEELNKKIKISRDRTMNFYVLLPEELKAGGAIPYILSFRRTSLQAGKKLATQMFVKNRAAGKSPAAVIMEVTVGKQTQDKKTWAVADVKIGTAAAADMQAEAFKWFQLVSSKQVKVDEESYNTEAKDDVKTSGESVDTGPSKF